MKSSEEILNYYYTKGADGMPEITAAGLLKAMEEYRLQEAKAAFDAARLYLDDMPAAGFKFETFNDYYSGLLKQAVNTSELKETQKIQLISDSIIEQFIPDDTTAKELYFDIRTNGIAYTVRYEKTAQGFWNFSGYDIKD